MALVAPASLSPSKVSSFTSCALQFRFATIDRLPEPPSPAATKGTLVHAALEHLFCLPAGQRSLPAALTALDEAFDRLRVEPEYTELGLDQAAERAFLDDAEDLVRKYFQLEDPDRVHAIGLELKLQLELEAEERYPGVVLRGIIDRLEIAPDGELVVTDYKTGRTPNAKFEQGRLGGVHLYALVCEKLFGRRPARVQLYFLADPMAIIAEPTEQSTRATERKLRAVRHAIDRACEHESFAPKPSRLCDWCAFQDRCPAFGGSAAT